MCFEFIKRGLAQKVGKPNYGLQDIGVSPAGPMDTFSMHTGNLVLDQDKWTPAIEFVLPPILLALEDVYIITTGARWEKILIEENGSEYEAEHASVLLIKKGSKISFRGKKTKGFRTYISYRKAENIKLKNKKRKDFKLMSSWYSSDNTIRVIAGPEHNTLSNSEQFLDYWKIGADTNQMGMRLENSKINLQTSCKNMISAPVADGTIQLTKNGPIILLKHRQTVGGYPRIFNVISADVDLLAQYAPSQLVKFSEVTVEEAIKINKLKKAQIERCI